MAKRKKSEVKPQEQMLINPDEDLFSQINSLVEESQNQASTWKSDNEKWHKLRMRIKKSKAFPFPGCANLRMPTVETKLRKLKSNLVRVVFGVRPIVQAIPEPTGNLQTAQKIEKFLDHLIMDIMDYKSKGIISIDQTIEKGFYLNKVYWKLDITTRIENFKISDLNKEDKLALYSLDTPREAIVQWLLKYYDVDMHELVSENNIKEANRCVDVILSGNEKVDCSFQDVLYNFPDVAMCNPEFVGVPSDSGWDVDKVRAINHEFYIPYEELKTNVKYKNWSKDALNEITSGLSRLSELDSTTEQIKSDREGITIDNNPSKLIRIWETYLYYDINNDGEAEKCVITSAPDFSLILRKITLPFFSGKWPFVKFVNEITDDRWYSHRGLPCLIEDLVKEIDTQHNQKLDNQTLRNTPMITFRAGVVNPNLVKFMTGQAIPRHDPDDITIMNNTNLNAEFSYEREQMALEAKIEELTGQVDYTLQSMINKRQPRTLGEVQYQAQSQQVVFSLDSETYTSQFSKLFSMIWDMWCQYGDDYTEFSYFGENGWEKIRLTKEEVQGKYKIVVRGNDQNFNPQQRQSKAEFMLSAISNPVALQSGIVQPQNIFNAYKRLFQVMDEQWNEFITDPSQLPPPPAPPPQVQLKPENLTDAELAQVKVANNIQPDVSGMQAKNEEQRIMNAHKRMLQIIGNKKGNVSPDDF